MKPSANLAWVAILLAVATSSAAQTLPKHDLKLVSIDVPPLSACTVRVGAAFLINGDEDHVSPVTATLHFRWADGSGPVPPLGSGSWRDIGDLTVQSGSDFFAIGRQWPDDFNVAEPTVKWGNPVWTSAFHLQAEVEYPGDEVAHNDVLTISGVQNGLKPYCAFSPYIGYYCLDPCGFGLTEHWPLDPAFPAFPF